MFYVGYIAVTHFVLFCVKSLFHMLMLFSETGVYIEGNNRSYLYAICLLPSSKDAIYLNASTIFNLYAILIFKVALKGISEY